MLANGRCAVEIEGGKGDHDVVYTVEAVIMGQHVDETNRGNITYDGDIDAGVTDKESILVHRPGTTANKNDTRKISPNQTSIEWEK